MMISADGQKSKMSLSDDDPQCQLELRRNTEHNARIGKSSKKVSFGDSEVAQAGENDSIMSNATSYSQHDEVLARGVRIIDGSYTSQKRFIIETVFDFDRTHLRYGLVWTCEMYENLKHALSIITQCEADGFVYAVSISEAIELSITIRRKLAIENSDRENPIYVSAILVHVGDELRRKAKINLSDNVPILCSPLSVENDRSVVLKHKLIRSNTSFGLMYRLAAEKETPLINMRRINSMTAYSGSIITMISTISILPQSMYNALESRAFSVYKVKDCIVSLWKSLLHCVCSGIPIIYGASCQTVIFPVEMILLDKEDEMITDVVGKAKRILCVSGACDGDVIVSDDGWNDEVESKVSDTHMTILGKDGKLYHEVTANSQTEYIKNDYFNRIESFSERLKAVEIRMGIKHS